MHRLTTEEKKRKGTLNKTREKEYEKKYADAKLRAGGFLTVERAIPCPASITDPYCKKYFSQLTQSLRAINVLSEADLPQIEQLVYMLQRLREIAKAMKKGNLYSDEVEALEKRYLKLATTFDSLASKYFISPAVRSKIRLEDLTIKEKQISIGSKEYKELSPTQRILLERDREDRGL